MTEHIRTMTDNLMTVNLYMSTVLHCIFIAELVYRMAGNIGGSNILRFGLKTGKINIDGLLITGYYADLPATPVLVSHSW